MSAALFPMLIFRLDPPSLFDAVVLQKDKILALSSTMSFRFELGGSCLEAGDGGIAVEQR